MFKNVKLNNFRKHTDASFSFAKGLNVIRGANESAKTTICESIAYAMFGARSLRESLDLCVTYGQPVSSLRVELDFAINGTDYRIKRGKSGAELFVGIKLIVTGQTEVTKYVENLLGASADATTKLMMANQTALRGALSDGPAAAVALIESLANFDLISQITELVQEKLPNGNTVALQSRIDTVMAQLDVPIEDDTAAYAKALAEAQSTSLLAAVDSHIAQAATDAALPAAKAALADKDAYAAAQTAYSKAALALQQASDRKVAISVPDEVPAAEIAALEAEVAAAADIVPAKAAWAKLQSLPGGDEWEGDAASFAKALQDANDGVTEEQAAISRAKVTLAELRGKLIKETHCAFCDKDLTDVPEVVQRNSALAPQIASALARTGFEKLNELSSTYAELTTLNKRAGTVMAAYQACAKYIKIDEGLYPPRFTWVGPDVSVEVNAKAAQQLATLKQRVLAREQALGRLQEASESLDAHAVRAKVLDSDLNAAKAAAETSAGALTAHAALLEASEAASMALGKASQAVTQAGQALKHARDLVAVRQKARDALQAQLAEDKALLVQTHFNNALIKKLRGARPQVADKLWSLVLATVSKYFSAIRGTPSRVTRNDNGFQVDGQGIGGLSGSTLDALGLAIRIALTKTFLPNTRWLVLDEASSACDSEREEAMVGCVATAGFDQIIWVTHSAAVEAFATTVVQL